MQKFINLVFYNGLTKDIYYKVKYKGTRENKKIVSAFSLITFVGFAFITVLTYLNGENVPLVLYIIPATVGLLFYFANKHLSKKLPIISDIFCVVLIIIILGSGIFLGNLQNTERTTLLLPFYFEASMLFSLRIFDLSILLILSQFSYIVFANIFQTGHILYINTVNTTIFFISAVISGAILTVQKYKRYEAEYQSEYLLERDYLTGVYNRSKSDIDLDTIIKNETPTIIFSFDVNGLKKINDTFGHKAGDELIKETAKCLDEVMGENGRIYRTGGDEFTGFMVNNLDKVDQIVKAMKDKAQSVKTDYLDGIEISIGYALLDHNFETEARNVINQADLKMYEDKNSYYTEKGIDRRKR